MRGVDERRRWDALMAEHHYLPYRGLFGKSLRQVAVRGETLAGAAGVAGRGVQGGGARRVDRLDAGAAVLAAAPDREQQPLRGAGRGPGSEPGVAGAGAGPAAAVGGHAGRARPPGAAGGDVRGPVAVRGHVLPGVELGAAGAHARLFRGSRAVRRGGGSTAGRRRCTCTSWRTTRRRRCAAGSCPGTGAPGPGRCRRRRPNCAACMRSWRTCRTSARRAGGATAWLIAARLAGYPAPRQAGRGQPGKPPTGSPRSARGRPVPRNSRPSSGATGRSRTGSTTCATSPTTRTARAHVGNLPRNLACLTNAAISIVRQRGPLRAPASRQPALRRPPAGGPRRRPGPADRLIAASCQKPFPVAAPTGPTASSAGRRHTPDPPPRARRPTGNDDPQPPRQPKSTDASPQPANRPAAKSRTFEYACGRHPLGGQAARTVIRLTLPCTATPARGRASSPVGRAAFKAVEAR